jgi:hypothetical protein
MTHTEPSAEHVRGEGGTTPAAPRADERDQREHRGLGQRLIDAVMGEDDRDRGRGRDADPAPASAAGYERGGAAGQEQGAVTDPTRSLADHVAPAQEPADTGTLERTEHDPSVVEQRQPTASVPEQDRGPLTRRDEAGSSSPTGAHAAQPVEQQRPAADDRPAPATGHDDGRATEATEGAQTPTAGERERLIPKQHADEYGARWDRLKGDFVDEPRRAVAQADALVGELLDELQELFSGQRRDLERDLSNDEASTEDLRLALRRYRSFFDRLLSF